jgi:hypothetical protein
MVTVTLVLMAALAASAHLIDQSRPEVAMAQAARAFMATLDPPQLEKARFAFDDAERFNWHFIPRARKGLPLKEMTEPQRKAAVALIQTGLSASGFKRAEAIRSLELVLRAMEKRDSRDPDMYFVTIFGTPGDARWGWRYEGHHLAQNWTIAQGKAVATSPAFFGASPAEVRDGPQQGLRALPEEADLAWTLLEALEGPAREAAIVGATAPADILTGASRVAAIEGNAGLPYSKMTAQAQRLLMNLIEAHANAQQPALAAARMARVKSGIDRTVFAWMGVTARNAGGHYYRIQGPMFLIEYDNTQNGANHQHVVWRDFRGDFGEDLLASHYAAWPHAGTESRVFGPAAQR